MRMKFYKDCLNNLFVRADRTHTTMLESSDTLREGYTLHYMLDVETRGSQSLLNINAFADPNNPNNVERKKVLIVWRKLTGKIEKTSCA